METLLAQGAESVRHRQRVFITTLFGEEVVVKERFSKKYRNPTLDASLTQRRFLQEARNMTRAKKQGVAVPTLLFLDDQRKRMYMELIRPAVTVKDFLALMPKMSESLLDDLASKIAMSVAKIHETKCIHGDLTSSNLLIKAAQASSSSAEAVVEAVAAAENVGVLVSCKQYLIDFGLSFISGLPEDKAVDLYCLERALLSTHPDSEVLVSPS
jgi:TP53 regulating kinase-like protein